MVDTDDLSVGDHVTVTYDSVRSESTAIIKELPPFTRTVCGEAERVTDKVRVQYPNITGGTGMLGDMLENVSPEQIEK